VVHDEPTLTYKLLRYPNSPVMERKMEVRSIRRAQQVMAVARVLATTTIRDRLFRITRIPADAGELSPVSLFVRKQRLIYKGAVR